MLEDPRIRKITKKEENKERRQWHCFADRTGGTFTRAL